MFIPGVGPYDCPRCGEKESAWGDSFCGKCESVFQEEMQRQAEFEKYGNAYMQEWGDILFGVQEIGLDYMKNNQNDWNIYSRLQFIEQKERIPQWVKEEQLKAVKEAIEQIEKDNKLSPPKDAYNYIPLV